MTVHDGRLVFPHWPCSAVQARSFEYLDDELAQGEREAIDAHLRRCAGCRHAFARDGAFRTQLRHATPQETAPDHLRSRLLDALRRASDGGVA
ncbi:MAG: zf-HC2 domain-containing protein [Gemmatimonadaceae bacterium]|jgi:mycothiol system anti-sigma-R factor|nr:zf-HC2 domain-containing protein [Gemmatimonadaceae bacterium]